MSAPDALTEELGGPPPPAIAALDDPVRDRLAGAVRDARRRQQDALDDASRDALRLVPAVLRGPVRRLVGL